LLFIFTIVNAQEFSYGVVLGNSFFDAGNNNGSDRMHAKSYSQFLPGVYGEYNFNENIGIKADVFLTNKPVNYFKYISGYTYQSEIDLKYFEFSTNLKYDFGNTYREGFYMLIGPKFNLLTKATSEGEDVKDSFESFYVSAQLGFGWRVFQFVDLQTKFEYDVMPFFKTRNDHNSKFFGAIVSVNIDIEKMLSN